MSRDIDFLGSNKLRTNLAIAIFALTVVVPALEYAGFMGSRILNLDSSTLNIVTGAGALIALFIANHKRILANVLGGPLMGLGVSFATLWYLSGRQNIIKLELLIPLIIGIVPGAVVYYLVVKFTEKNNKQQEENTDNNPSV